MEAWGLLMDLVLDQRWQWAEVATQLRITQAGLRALLAIEPNRPPSMRDLAGILNCDPSYVTAMVDDLESAGYVTRRAAPRDRRIKSVALTQAGLDALRTARDGLFSPPLQLTRLPPARQRRLAQLLREGLTGPEST
jgi:DNA-binding MarR family transcriptional regulator